MKNLKCSLPMKITAVILSYVMALVLVLSTVAIAFMGYFNFYFNSQETLQKEILGEMAMGECYTLAILSENERNIQYYYEDRNLFYMIEDADGKLLESNYKGEKGWKFRVLWKRDGGNPGKLSKERGSLS